MAELDDFTLNDAGTVLDAIAVMESNHARTALVLDSDKLVGVISEGDVIRALLRGVTVNAPLKEVMRVSFKFLCRHDEVEALALFKQFGFNLAPIVDDQMHLIGVITLGQILEKVQLGRTSFC